ncbi:hypothetical protein P280DRAFT_478202 [Massarina eburnea CBS 473.64]|uniref:Mid2 domain-containing protein n=1 Tax=Massarina eburnea CBS 473.64 TaxID=1395130 RepID=A0A6A6S714_9PLEO|nr:hypothetical protein P280DRAFT_478202 [Massarina eburnea CBS 473.64]
MSEHASITTPPKPLLPRQTYDPNNPYILSSLYAELSSLYPELYSSYSYNSRDYASLMDYYSSLLESYSVTGYSFPTMTAVGTGATRIPTSAKVTASGSRATATAAASGGKENEGNGGLSTGAKIGIGVGVTLAVLLLAGIGIFLWCMGKRKGKKSSTTVVAPSQTGFSVQPQISYAGQQGYTPSLQQQQLAVSPPLQYAQPQQPQQSGVGMGMAVAYGDGYMKALYPNAAELEHEYHFANPGVVEMGDGLPETETPQKQTGKLSKKR